VRALRAPPGVGVRRTRYTNCPTFLLQSIHSLEKAVEVLVQNFIDKYCTPTDHVSVSKGTGAHYRVYLVSPAAIMSTMHSTDSDHDHDVIGLDQSWSNTLDTKRSTNDYDLDFGYGPLDFLKNVGFRTPLCIAIRCDKVYCFHNGNHRLAAAIDLGYERVPVVFVDIDGDNWADLWDVTEGRGRVLLSPRRPWQHRR